MVYQDATTTAAGSAPVQEQQRRWQQLMHSLTAMAFPDYKSTIPPRGSGSLDRRLNRIRPFEGRTLLARNESSPSMESHAAAGPMFSPRNMSSLNRPPASSLLLQMLLYFHRPLLLLWLACQCRIVYFKLEYSDMSAAYRYIAPTLIALCTCCDIARLRLGYAGNLREQIPELVGAFLLSLFPILPTFLYFLLAPITTKNMIPLEQILNCIMVVLLTVEMSIIYGQVREAVRQQSDYFLVMMSEMDDDTVNNNTGNELLFQEATPFAKHWNQPDNRHRSNSTDSPQQRGVGMWNSNSAGASPGTVISRQTNNNSRIQQTRFIQDD